MEGSRGEVRTAYDIQVIVTCGPGRPKMIWNKLTENDCHEQKLSAVYPREKNTWR